MFQSPPGPEAGCDGPLSLQVTAAMGFNPHPALKPGATILEDATRFRLISLNVDRLFQGYQLSQELADEGLEVFGMGQGFLSMAAPMKEFERRLLARKLNHGGNPVLRFMADSVAVRQDPAGNLKPDKAASQGRIDGIVALIMALDRAMRHEPPKRSVYEERGLEVV